MKILVLGGTRFVGKRLVNLLVAEGHEVTVGSRGQTAAQFDGPVERLQLNRSSRDSLSAALQGREWDVVYDQICYSPEDAELSAELFQGKTKRYIEVSTLSVYGGSPHAQQEADWSPEGYPVTGSAGEKLSYGEGKRQAEAVLYDQVKDFETVMVRFPSF